MIIIQVQVGKSIVEVVLLDGGAIKCEHHNRKP